MRLIVHNTTVGVNVRYIVRYIEMYNHNELWINGTPKNLWASSLYRFPSVESLFRLVYDLDHKGKVRK